MQTLETKTKTKTKSRLILKLNQKFKCVVHVHKQCTAITLEGTRCKYNISKVDESSVYCGRHIVSQKQLNNASGIREQRLIIRIAKRYALTVCPDVGDKKLCEKISEVFSMRLRICHTAIPLKLNAFLKVKEPRFIEACVQMSNGININTNDIDLNFAPPFARD